MLLLAAALALVALAVALLDHPGTPSVSEALAARGQAAARAEPQPEGGVAEPEPDPSTLAGLLRAGSVSSIRVLGDSITAGYLATGSEEPSDTGVVVYSGPEGVCEETSTQARCWTNSFRAFARERGVERFVNAGVSGWRMQYLAESPASWLGEGADVIVVMLGTNDAARSSLEEFEAYAREGLAAAAAACSHLVVVSPPNNDRTDAANRFGMDEVDRVLAQVCLEEGWEHVSLTDALTPHTGDYHEDQVHPTDEGAQRLWEAFRERLDLS